MLSSSTFSQGSWSRSTGLLIIGGHPMGKIPASSSEDSSSKGVCWYLSKDGQFLMFLWWYTCIWGTLCLSRFWFWGGNIPDCSNLVHSWLICPCSCLCCCFQDLLLSLYYQQLHDSSLVASLCSTSSCSHWPAINTDLIPLDVNGTHKYNNPANSANLTLRARERLLQSLLEARFLNGNQGKPFK